MFHEAELKEGYILCFFLKELFDIWIHKLAVIFIHI